MNYSGNYLLLRGKGGERKRAEKKKGKDQRGDNEGKIYDPVRGETAIV